jgi:N6-L-threonylcarbamoyladenine synthase
MIGAAGYYLFKAGVTADMALNGYNHMDIEQCSIES